MHLSDSLNHKVKGMLLLLGALGFSDLTSTRYRILLQSMVEKSSQGLCLGTLGDRKLSLSKKLCSAGE